ncbi:hypothetical protein ACFL0Z_00190 [Patescibacteria group bacterium]
MSPTSTKKHDEEIKKIERQIELHEEEISTVDAQLFDVEEKIEDKEVELAESSQDSDKSASDMKSEIEKLESMLGQAETKTEGVKQSLFEAKRQKDITYEAQSRVEAEIMSIERSVNQAKEKQEAFDRKKKKDIRANKRKLLDLEAVMRKLEMIMGQLNSAKIQLKLVETREIAMERSKLTEDKERTRQPIIRKIPDSEITNLKIREARTDARLLERELSLMTDDYQEFKKRFEEIREIIEKEKSD